MNTQEEKAEYLEQINFGDGEPEPAQEPEVRQEPAEAEEEVQEQAPAEKAAPARDQDGDDLEQNARELGWRPKEDWNGDPDNWVDAQTFLAKGERLLPIMKADRKRLLKEIAEVRQDLRNFQDYHKKDRERVAQRAYEQGLQELKAKQRQAVEDGDTYEYDKLEKERETLEKTHNGPESDDRASAQPTAPTRPVDQNRKQNFEDWKAKNPWLDTDATMAAYTQTAANFVEVTNKDIVVDSPEFFEEVTKEVRRRFPEKFENPRRKGAPDVGSSDYVGARGSNSGKKTFADLPRDAQVEAKKMERAGMKISDYVSEYFGNNTISFGD